MIQKLKSSLGFIKNSYKDWSINRKIVVIESDDWGSIRMPSKESFNALLKKNIEVDKCPFLKYDSFENREDFEAIENIFSSIYEQTNKRPVITANYILSNPDFEKIMASDFKKYYRKFFWDHLSERSQLNEYKNCVNSLMKKKFFYPQLHGMEHVQVPYWLRNLKDRKEESLEAFRHEVYGISTNVSKEKRDTYLATLNYYDDKELDDFMLPSLSLASQKFQSFFGYKSKSFIAPNYVWSSNIEIKLNEVGVDFIQSSRSQMLPKKYGDRSIIKRIGEQNSLGQIYLVRNSIFEPSTSNEKKKMKDKCLEQINMAFHLNKPATISMHRLNFMGGFVESNRDENLLLLKEILLKVIKKWPNVEFMHSEELGRLIKDSKKHA
ncbi:hypothetical protein SAMN05444278_103257 [Psychroflexus salarius]|uniref:Polysaccharide deacetylase n=1 Tax=Psychroflexus salarius TaxID=1155689 RepID=A0A1M4V5N7_9FLAO|nr:hypothetical protein [Psychroflexus salarius]SHE64239.1 hypothetical protein SAMN05444278_103257 [Psychroflexus salarius]